MSTPVPLYARLGVMRLAASRLDYYQPIITITVNGVTRTTNCRVEGLTIRDYLDGQPNIATLRVDGFTPTTGHEIKIGLGALDTSHLLFAGHIQTRMQVYEGKPANVAWDLTCVSYEWLLNRRKVVQLFVGYTATFIAQTLINGFAAGFTSNNVESGLDTVDEISFTNEAVTDCLDRLARRVGAYWYIDYARDLHFFTTSEGSAQPITDSNDRGMRGLNTTTDLSPVRTRVYSEGGGGIAVIDTPAGSTEIPVDSQSWYNASGGTVVSGQQHIAYDSIDGRDGEGSATGSIVEVPNTSSMAGSGFNTGNGILGLGQKWFVVTFETGDGETTQSTSVVTVTLTGVQNAISFTNVPTSSAATVTDRRIYMSQTSSSGPFNSYFPVGNNTTTSISVGFTPGGEAVLGAPPTIYSAGYGAPTAVGASSLPVLDTAPFSNAGGWAAVAGQILKFTSASSTAITGIPASGRGSILSEIPVNTPIVNVAHLSGIAASGVGSVQYLIKVGDPVNLLMMVQDATAQTAMGTLTGGDGVHEEYLVDNRLSETEAEARAQATLTLLKDPLVTVRYETTDQSTFSGRDVSITLSSPTSITQTLKIQSVTITTFSPTNAWFPMRAVEASSRRQSFEALLRLLKRATN